MTIEEVQNAFAQQALCEFYSSGRGWVSWLDEGWHNGTIVSIDENFPCVVLHIAQVCAPIHTIIVEVRGEEHINTLLRLYQPIHPLTHALPTHPRPTSNRAQ